MPDAEPPIDESLPTPVPRLPHEGDAPAEALAGEEPAPRSAAPQAAPKPAAGRRPIELGGRPGGERRPGPVRRRPSPMRSCGGSVAPVGCWPSATRTPTPTRSGRPWRSPARRAPGRARRHRHDRPDPADLRLPRRASSASEPIRTRTRITTCSSSPTAAPSTASGRYASDTASCSNACRGSSSTTTSRTTRSDRADWIDPAAAATCEMVALLAARLGVPLDAGGGVARDGADGGDGHGHGDVRPPEHHAPDARGRGGAARGRGAPADISRRLYRTQAGRPAAALRSRARPARDPTLDGRLVWSRLLDEDLAATGAEPPHSEGIIDLLAQAEDGRGGDPVQGVARRARGSASGPGPAAWTRRC